MCMEDDYIVAEGELLDDSPEVLSEETQYNNTGEIKSDEESIFISDDINSDNDLVEDTSSADIEGHSQVSDEVLNFQDSIQNVTEPMQVGADPESDPEQQDMISGENSEQILASLQIVQRNVKTGFDNLSLIGSVQVGLTAFLIGAVIIYCYIGRFK